MNPKAQQIILYTTLIIIGSYFLILGLVHAKSFLIPFTLAAILAMVLLPVEKRLKSWGLSKGLAVLLSVLLLLGFFVGLFFVLSTQIKSISENWPEYEKKLQPKIEQVKEFVTDKTGIGEKEQEKKIEEAIKKSEPASAAAKIIPGIFNLGGNFLLIFVYIFFFLFYKQKFRKSILNFFPKANRKHASEVLTKFSSVSQKYLFGRFILIIFLSIAYAIGLSIIGVKHAILISVLAAVMTIIPYIGNLVGIVLALTMSLLTEGSTTQIIGILVLFTLTQFIESYLLEPFIVGRQVEINPVVTIFSVIIGGAIWGLAGMMIAIPVIAILKIVFDNVEVLNPLGYMLDEQDTGSDDGWITKIKDRIVSKFKK